LAFRPAEFEGHVLSFPITSLGKAFAKGSDLLGSLGSRAENREILQRASRAAARVPPAAMPPPCRQGA